MVYSKHQNQIEIETFGVETLINQFQVEMTKKHLDLRTYQQSCSMNNIYQGNIYANFSEHLLLKCNENAVLFFEITQNKVKCPFYLENGFFCYVMFGGCP